MSKPSRNRARRATGVGERCRRRVVAFFSALSILSLAAAGAAAAECDSDAVRVGDVCVDKYEASVWSTPQGGAPGTQLTSYPCAADGQDCGGKIFARSVSGVAPARDISWFQALAACANVGKRLLTNAEWQMAAAGTVDRGAADDHDRDCNTNTPFPPLPAGSRLSCVSFYGAYDMVGNVWEWVSDWVPRSQPCPGWGAFSDDTMCLSGAVGLAQGPGAIYRGGDFSSGNGAGAFAISGQLEPYQQESVGFRCAR